MRDFALETAAFECLKNKILNIRCNCRCKNILHLLICHAQTFCLVIASIFNIRFMVAAVKVGKQENLAAFLNLFKYNCTETLRLCFIVS